MSPAGRTAGSTRPTDKTGRRSDPTENERRSGSDRRDRARSDPTDKTGRRSDPTENERRSGSDAGDERLLLTAK